MLATDLQRPQSRSPITYSKVLLVEGRDAFEFSKALLRHLGLLSEIEIRNFGGLADLADYLEALKVTPGFLGAVSLGILRDAEANLDSAFQSVCSALKRSGYSVPGQPMAIAEGSPRVSVFILPDCANPGMLEDLCLQAVANDPTLACVEQYLRCLQEQGVGLPNNVPKARLHAFLASRPVPDLQLGEAAHRGYWLWDSPVFDYLKGFLRAL